MMFTDDAYTRGYTGCEPFGPNEDYDPMYDDAPGDGPKCGGCRGDEGWSVGDGCRHCNPVDHECKPQGFGIEAFEDPALEAANCEMAKRRPQALYTSAGAYARTYWMRDSKTGWMLTDEQGRPVMGVVVDSPAYYFDREMRNTIWLAGSKRSARRERHSDIVWNRICDDAETHGEAVRRYEEWAKRAVTVRYRDEN